MKKVILIVSSVLLVVVLVAVYLAFIRKDIYVLNMNPRYTLQLISDNFNAVKQAIRASPNFKRNLLVIFSQDSKQADSSSSILLDPPDGFSVLYYSDWREVGPFDILYIYIVDATFASALKTGVPATDPVKNLMFLLSTEFFKKYDFSQDESARIQSLMFNPPAGRFIDLKQK